MYYWWIFAVCLILFIVSFSILFKTKLKKMFLAIGKFFKTIFSKIHISKKKDKKEKKNSEDKKARVTASDAQKRPVLLAPDAKKLEAPKEEEKSVGLTEKFATPNTFLANKEKQNRKDEISNLAQKNGKIELNKVEFTDSNEVTSSPPPITNFMNRSSIFNRNAMSGNKFPSKFETKKDIIDSSEDDDEFDKIIKQNVEKTKNRIKDFNFDEMKKDYVNVDGCEIDLQKLPPKLRRLLLSGLLARIDIDSEF